MQVKITDSFFESLEKLIRSEKPFYKFIDFIRYTIPRFFKNIYKFRKELADYQDWDSMYNLKFFYRTLLYTRNYLKNYGIEVEEHRSKKIAKMDRAIKLLEDILEDNFIQQAEEKIGHEIDSTITPEGILESGEYDKEIFMLANDLENSSWEEFWTIIKGSDYSDKYDFNITNKIIDGANMRGWWD